MARILARYLALLRNIYNVSFKSPKVGRHFTFIGAKSTSKMANCVNWLTLWTNNRPTKWDHYQKQTKIEFDDQKFGCTSRKSHLLVVWLKVNYAQLKNQSAWSVVRDKFVSCDHSPNLARTRLLNVVECQFHHSRKHLLLHDFVALGNHTKLFQTLKIHKSQTFEKTRTSTSTQSQV